jgi:uncharacterized phage-like protein YoqJ
MQIDINKTICFTGHRPDSLYGYDPYVEGNKNIIFILRDIIQYHIEKQDIDTFITGMALGIDQWSARVVLKLKEQFPHIKLVAAIPCTNHSSKWNKESQQEWQRIIDNCDYTHYISNEPFTKWCMQKRNEWMVDNSSTVVAVYNESGKGGTYNCIKYAEKKGKKIIKLNPNTFEVK